MKGGLRERIREIYKNCICEGSLNLSGIDIPYGKKLAEEFGYPEDVLRKIPGAYLNSFAGCGNPWSHVRVMPGWKILDIGCGCGIDMAVASGFLNDTGLVIGIDFVFEMVEAGINLVRHFLQDEKEKIFFLNGDGECLPFKERRFDLVVCNGVLSLFQDKAAVLKEIYRVLGDGGTLVVCDLIRLCPLPEYFYEDKSAWAWCMSGALSKTEIQNLFSDVGFSTLKFSWGNTLGYFGRATVLGIKEGGKKRA